MADQQKYGQVLDFLYRQLPMFQRVGPAAFKKDLSNIRALCAALGQPERQFPSIHVGGTNGKGSTAHMLAAALQAMGYRVGLYTSPHYRDFRERIKINGEYVSRAYVIEFVEKHASLFEEIKPSFFEITVAMAFDFFARRKVDIAVVEVGLGGRLDSTNVLHPLLSVITNISFDHMEFLGDTLPLIAAEKAGIIKDQVPVVIGETQAETQPVFLKIAEEQRAPIVFADQHYRAEAGDSTLEYTTYNVYKDGLLWAEGLELNAHGPYQYKNLQTALQALELLPPSFQPDERQLRDGLLNLRKYTRLLGRWQIIGKRPTVLCDSAHNEAGMELAMEALKGMPHEELHVVLGMVKDKEPGKLLRHMPKEARYYFARPDIPRGQDAGVLRDAAAVYGLEGKAYSSVRNALRAARRNAGPRSLVYVGGSIFVVAEVVRP